MITGIWAAACTPNSTSRERFLYVKLFVLVTLLTGVALFATLRRTRRPRQDLAWKVSDAQNVVKDTSLRICISSLYCGDNHAFELSGLQMVQLKKEGISDNIIKVMPIPVLSVFRRGPAGSAMGILPGMITTAKPSGATPSTVKVN